MHSLFRSLGMLSEDGAKDPQGRISLLMSIFQFVVSDRPFRDCRSSNPFLLHLLRTRAAGAFSIITNPVSSHAKKELQP